MRAQTLNQAAKTEKPTKRGVGVERAMSSEGSAVSRGKVKRGGY